MTAQETTFTSEEICVQAKGNVNAFILGSIAILKRQGASIEEHFTALGQIFAPGWEQVNGKGALAAALPAALNLVSGGATLESLTGDEREAQVVISGWPKPEDLEFVHLDRSDIEPFWSIFRPIADYLDLSLRAEPQGDRVRFTFTQR